MCAQKNELTSSWRIFSYSRTIYFKYLHCRYLSDPPGPPEIEGYQTGKVVKTGDTMKLMCTSKGGNPLAQVYW